MACSLAVDTEDILSQAFTKGGLRDKSIHITNTVSEQKIRTVCTIQLVRWLCG